MIWALEMIPVLGAFPKGMQAFDPTKRPEMTQRGSRTRSRRPFSAPESGGRKNGEANGWVMGGVFGFLFEGIYAS